MSIPIFLHTLQDLLISGPLLIGILVVVSGISLSFLNYYYKILAILLVLYNIFLQLIYFNFKIFYCTIVESHYCVSFCSTAK